MSEYPRSPTHFVNSELRYDFMIQFFEFCFIVFIFIIFIKITNCNYEPKNTDLSQFDFICNSIEWFEKDLRKSIDDTHGWFTPLN